MTPAAALDLDPGLLGKKLQHATLTYARAHDETVADDDDQAMSSVEKRLDSARRAGRERRTCFGGRARVQTSALTEKLAEPEQSAGGLAGETFAGHIRWLLLGKMKMFPSQAPDP